jgi:glycosidase
MRDVINHRRGTNEITWAWQINDDIRQHMLYFLENHDEQRVASDFFAGSGVKAKPAVIVNLLMQQNPFMLYAGQEYGERGMDEEGFSGRDGRTTIFDYWSVDTLCRAASGQLTGEEQELFAFYKRLLNIALSEKAITEGVSFDLTYANALNFRQYSFLRKFENETIFVVANFEDIEANIKVCIPAHAFDYLVLDEGTYAACDLLTGATCQLEFRRDTAVELNLPRHGGLLLKLSKQ